MTKYNTFNHEGSKLNNLYNESIIQSIDTEQELAKKGVNLRLFNNANLFLTIIKKISNKSTEWMNADFVQEDGKISVIYKEWEIPIVSTEESGLQSLATIIIPYITYNILYETPEDNDIDFYNDEFNLKQTSFFEIKNDTLYLKLSLYIQKYFDSRDLIVPRVKVLVDFKNPYTQSR